MQPVYIPDRNDIVWLDFEPTEGKAIGKYRPAPRALITGL